MKPSSSAPRSSAERGNRRTRYGPSWQPDATDRRIVELLLSEGRMPNAELARRIGLPESTCSIRVRTLREQGVLAGVHADVDLARLGRAMEAMVAVRFAGHRREQMDAFRAAIVTVPGVIAAYHVAGENDFLIHVCAESPHALRDFVLDRLTGMPGIAQAQTSLIFERLRGTDPLG
ncbi:Lrp/AsnC family transcriptional regulator [Dermacoccus nishinomiyaensis]|uniref:Lrp/AsnC family transcriptional regulator n=1 Tax=Dermacoccus nishinomiyaensis TaxID=1274 RepID=UPI00248E66E2|nr:Lrp/AsnC family transcriptional regulator [Dermacoccus nishinomiyaensis]